MHIEFNRPYSGALSKDAVYEVLLGNQFAGGGNYSKKCQDFFRDKYGFEHNYLTSSCTDALEMCAMLLNISEGDQVIIPSFSYVTCAHAFKRHGATIVFADSLSNSPHIDPESIRSQINDKTKALVVIHYAGIAHDLSKLVAICKESNIALIEDAAQCVDAFFDKTPLGKFGTFSTFSFHETKNIHCGEGGLLVVNDPSYVDKAQILIDKGTNRREFQLGLIPKYECVETSSSFLPSELQSAFLYGQLLELNTIQKRRQKLWDHYYRAFSQLTHIELPNISSLNNHNSHCFYLTLENETQRNHFIRAMKAEEISVCLHFQHLHKSPLYIKNSKNHHLENASRYSECLIRFPLYFGLTDAEQFQVIKAALKWLPKSST